MSKKYQRVSCVKKLDVYDMDGPANLVLERLQKIVKEAEDNGWTNLYFDIRMDCDWGDASMEFDLNYNRQETDKERDQRLERARKVKADKTEARIAKVARDEALYLKLKERFGND